MLAQGGSPSRSSSNRRCWLPVRREELVDRGHFWGEVTRVTKHLTSSLPLDNTASCKWDLYQVSDRVHFDLVYY